MGLRSVLLYGSYSHPSLLCSLTGLSFLVNPHLMIPHSWQALLRIYDDSIVYDLLLFYFLGTSPRDLFLTDSFVTLILTLDSNMTMVGGSEK